MSTVRGSRRRTDNPNHHHRPKKPRSQGLSDLFRHPLIRHNPPIPRILGQGIPLSRRLMIAEILRPRRKPAFGQLRRFTRNPTPQIRSRRRAARKIKLALPRHPALHLEDVDARCPGRGGNIGRSGELAGSVVEGIADNADGRFDIGFLVFADNETVRGGAAVEGDPRVAKGGVGLFGFPVEFPVRGPKSESAPMTCGNREESMTYHI